MYSNSDKGILGLGAMLILVFVCVISFFVFGKSVDQSEVCVTTRFGKVTGVAGPGLHWRIPGITRYNCYSSRDVIYETSDHTGESKADYTDAATSAQTSDGQQISLKYSISFHVDKDNAREVYEKTGKNMDEVVERSVKLNSRSEVRNEIPNHTAEQLYSGERRTLEAALDSSLKVLLAQQGVTMTSFRLRDIGFDADYVAAIEQQQIAQLGIKTAEFQSQQAEFEANRQAALAKGEADAAIELARGEAESIRVRGEALRAYPEILQLEFIEKAQFSWGIMPFENVQPFLPLQSPAAQ